MKNILVFIILFISLSVKSQNFIDLESGNHQLIKTKIDYDGKNLNNVKDGINLIALTCKFKCKNEFSYRPEIIKIRETENLFYFIMFYYSSENIYGARSESVSMFYYDGISFKLFDIDALNLYGGSILTREDIKKHFDGIEQRRQEEIKRRIEQQRRDALEREEQQRRAELERIEQQRRAELETEVKKIRDEERRIEEQRNNKVGKVLLLGVSGITTIIILLSNFL